ncbi:MAG: cysteine desulfurase [Clostridiales bacterium]|nr:cysteine desulfurase [Clostridiales bacterium]
MEAYLDNSATTRCSQAAARMMMEVLTADYGNPSSLHGKGKVAEDYVVDAQRKIARTLKVQEKEIVFTSGGTESNNLALFGVARANRRAGKHIITTFIEHASVSTPLKSLENDGYEVTYMPVDHYGILDVDALVDAVREDTILVSIIHVNNEIGAIQNIEEIGRRIKEKNPGTVFHVDAIQSYGKLRIAPNHANIDLLSVSGHKIHGPKGSGFLYIKDKTKIAPLLLGGGQQKGMRSGTENVPAIAGLGVAAEEIYTDFDEKIGRMYALRDRFIAGAQEIEGVMINGRTDHTNAPHIVSVSVEGADARAEGVRAEVLLHALEDRGIYVSAGSACSSNKPSVSSTLRSIGIPANLLGSTVRFSFCVNTTEEEIDYALEVMREIIPMLRRYTRR